MHHSIESYHPARRAWSVDQRRATCNRISRPAAAPRGTGPRSSNLVVLEGVAILESAHEVSNLEVKIEVTRLYFLIRDP